MNNKWLYGILFSVIFSANFAFATEQKIKKEPDFLDKATQLTNKAILNSKKIAKDVIDKTTVLTNKAAESSTKIAKDVIDKATKVTNKVLHPEPEKKASENVDKKR